MTIEVLLTGSFGVGKSSIFNRVIHNDFSHQYYGTMGVRVNEKRLEEQNITIKLWDIAGEIQQRKVPKIYFAKKSVILYVVDITRPFTFNNIIEDIDYLKKHTVDSIIKIVGNKADILNEEELQKVQNKDLPVKLDWITSAKTGKNITQLFESLGAEVLKKIKNKQEN